MRMREPIDTGSGERRRRREEDRESKKGNEASSSLPIACRQRRSFW